jgi:hypothetical protein
MPLKSPDGSGSVAAVDRLPALDETWVRLLERKREKPIGRENRRGLCLFGRIRGEAAPDRAPGEPQEKMIDMPGCFPYSFSKSELS